jgi:hypothetical protein
MFPPSAYSSARQRIEHCDVLLPRYSIEDRTGAGLGGWKIPGTGRDGASDGTVLM